MSEANYCTDWKGSKYRLIWQGSQMRVDLWTNPSLLPNVEYVTPMTMCNGY